MFSHVQTQGESKPFFESARRVGGGVECEITPESTCLLLKIKKISPFVKFEIILFLLCCLLYCLTNKYSSAWSYRINFVDGFQDLSKEFCCVQGDGLIIT